MSYLAGLPSEKNLALYTKRDLIALLRWFYDTGWIRSEDYSRAINSTKPALIKAIQYVYYNFGVVGKLYDAESIRHDRAAGIIRDARQNEVGRVPPDKWWECQAAYSRTYAPYYEWLMPDLYSMRERSDENYAEYRTRCQALIAPKQRAAAPTQPERSNDWLANLVKMFGADPEPVRRIGGYAGYILPDGRFINLPEKNNDTMFLYHGDAARMTCPPGKTECGYWSLMRNTRVMRFHLFKQPNESKYYRTFNRYDDELDFMFHEEATIEEAMSAVKLMTIAQGLGITTVVAERGGGGGLGDGIWAKSPQELAAFMTNGKLKLEAEYGPYTSFMQKFKHRHEPYWEETRELRGARCRCRY